MILSITLLVALAAAVFAMYFWNQATQSAEEANQQRSEALAQRSTAQAYSILADQGRVTAVAAQSTAIMGQSTAEAASIQALAGRAASMAAEVTAIAGRDAAATAQVYAEQQRDEAERQGRIALSRGLSSLALNTMDRQLDLSLLMAIEAFRAIEQYPPVDTLQARNALLTG